MYRYDRYILLYIFLWPLVVSGFIFLLSVTLSLEEYYYFCIDLVYDWIESPNVAVYPLSGVFYVVRGGLVALFLLSPLYSIYIFCVVKRSQKAIGITRTVSPWRTFFAIILMVWMGGVFFYSPVKDGIRVDRLHAVVNTNWLAFYFVYVIYFQTVFTIVSINLIQIISFRELKL